MAGQRNQSVHQGREGSLSKFRSDGKNSRCAMLCRAGTDSLGIAFVQSSSWYPARLLRIIKLIRGWCWIRKPESDSNVFLGFNRLPGQQGFRITPLPNSIHGCCHEDRRAIDRLQVLYRPLTANNSVKLYSTLDALLFCFLRVNGLDAREHVAELQARGLTLFFRNASIGYPKGRIGIGMDRNRRRNFYRNCRQFRRRHRGFDFLKVSRWRV